MTERPENLTGTVTYWNGASGWIKRDVVAGQTTAESGDVLVRAEDIASGMIQNGTLVSFWFDRDYGIARDVKVVDAVVDPPPEPAPDSPPDLPPDSPPDLPPDSPP